MQWTNYTYNFAYWKCVSELRCMLPLVVITKKTWIRFAVLRPTLLCQLCSGAQRNIRILFLRQVRSSVGYQISDCLHPCSQQIKVSYKASGPFLCTLRMGRYLWVHCCPTRRHSFIRSIALRASFVIVSGYVATFLHAIVISATPVRFAFSTLRFIHSFIFNLCTN